jgi:hypothetical protein
VQRRELVGALSDPNLSNLSPSSREGRAWDVPCRVYGKNPLKIESWDINKVGHF